MTGEMIILGGIIAFVFGLLVLVRPNIAIPGVVLGTPALYIIVNDGLWAFARIVGVLVLLIVVLSLFNTVTKNPEKS